MYVVSWLPLHIGPFARVHHRSSVFRCSHASASIHPKEERGREQEMEDVEEESAEGLFPSERGGKNNQENILLREKKNIFLLCWVTMKSVNF